MATLKWSAEKERLLRQETTRNTVTFVDCVVAVEEGRILDILPHPTRDSQSLLILNIENYAYVVPYVIEEDGSWFFKTVFPSRKHTALYLKEQDT